MKIKEIKKRINDALISLNNSEHGYGCAGMLGDLLNDIGAENTELYDTLKEVTDQMNNSGNGEHTIPSWFARSLYEVLDRNKAEG